MFRFSCQSAGFVWKPGDVDQTRKWTNVNASVKYSILTEDHVWYALPTLLRGGILIYGATFNYILAILWLFQ